MNEHRKLANSEDAARDGPDSASPNLQPPWRDAILQPPAPQANRCHRATVGDEPAEPAIQLGNLADPGCCAA